MAKGTGELKFLDTIIDVTAFVVPTAGLIVPTINVIPEGTSQSTRVGRRVRIKSFELRYTTFVDQAAAGDQADVLRVVVYEDRQTNGVAATAIQLFDTNSTFPGFRELDNGKRFVMLSDEIFAVNQQSGLSSIHTTKTTHIVRKDNLGIIVEYDNTFPTGVLSTMRSNNIGLLFQSERGLVRVQKNALVRIRFYDG